MLEAHQETPERESSHWQALVNEVTERLEATSASLAALREAVQRLTLAQPSASQPSVHDVPSEPAADPRTAVVETVPVESAVSDEEEARREEVRRAVEQARTEMERIWSPDGLASVSEGSWPSRSGEQTDRPEENGHHTDWDGEEMASDADTEDPDREQVRRAVEQARAELEAGPVFTDEEAETGDDDDVESEPTDQDVAREQIRKALEQLRAELSSEDDWSHDASGEGSWPTAGAPGEQAAGNRETAGQWPASDHAWGWPSLASTGPQKPEGTGTDVDNREQPDGAPVSGDEDARGNVRRAVEQTRSELTGSQAEPSAGGGTQFAWPEHKGDMADTERLLTPPSLVIEDPQGRIELARVYETLNRLEFASDAALLNYTAHQVTVSLGSSRNIPSAETVAAAVRSAFGRTCEVKMDGSHIAARIGDVAARAA